LGKYKLKILKGDDFIKKITTKQEYQEYVNTKTPNSPILSNCFHAFLVGGLICAIGQTIFEFFKLRGLEDTTCYTIVSITLIFITAFLTSMNIFNKIGKFAGAGSFVPITGFANSIVSPAMEYKSEGYVLGVGAKMFTVAGPVLVYGISSSIIVGILYIILNSQSIILV
jgi:stage V sporulation protein AC